MKTPENNGSTSPPAIGKLGATGSIEPQETAVKYPSTLREAADRLAQRQDADTKLLSECQSKIQELVRENAALTTENKYLLLDRQSKELVLIISSAVTVLGTLGLGVFETAPMKWGAALIAAFSLFFSLLFGIMIWVKDTRPNGTNRRITVVLFAMIFLVILSYHERILSALALLYSSK